MSMHVLLCLAAVQWTSKYYKQTKLFCMSNFTVQKYQIDFPACPCTILHVQSKNYLLSMFMYILAFP